MNRKMYVLLSVIVLLILCSCYVFFLNSIDTKYAVDFSKVFSTYDINCINNYLTDDTIIICNDKHVRYAELRNNVEIACKERRYQFDSSYGHGNSGFKNNVQKITIYLYGKLDGEGIGEVNVMMRLKKMGRSNSKLFL